MKSSRSRAYVARRMARADREWIRRLIDQQTEAIKDHLDYAIREEAQLHVLKDFAAKLGEKNPS
jgi:hypothetical protein